MAISPEPKGVGGELAASSPKMSARRHHDDEDFTAAVCDGAGGEAGPALTSPSAAPTFVPPSRPKVPKLTGEGYYMVR